MNPLTQTRNLMKMNDRELEMGIAGTKNSWHQEYKDSAWVFFGGMPFELSEGDIICVFSQYGEVVHINLIRDHSSGKSKGFGFLCYEDQRSTILAVDNLNGYNLLKRMIRVDHIHQYKLPKDLEKLDQDKKRLLFEGVAPKVMSDTSESSENEEKGGLLPLKKEKKKKSKKDKKSKKKKKKKKKDDSSEDDSDAGKDVARTVSREKYDRERLDRDDNGHKDRKRRSRSRDRDRDIRRRSRSRERRSRSRDRRSRSPCDYRRRRSRS